MAKQKKKRNKKYRPKDGSFTPAPIVHRFVAEDEAKVDKRKKLKRRAIVVAVIGLPLALLLGALL